MVTVHYECCRYRLKKNLSRARESPSQFFYRDKATNVKNAIKRIQQKALTQVILEQTADHLFLLLRVV